MCMNELGINGYIIPDFSIQCEVLEEGNEDVAAVSELTARGNTMQMRYSGTGAHMCIYIIFPFNVVHIIFVDDTTCRFYLMI